MACGSVHGLQFHLLRSPLPPITASRHCNNYNKQPFSSPSKATIKGRSFSEKRLKKIGFLALFASSEGLGGVEVEQNVPEEIISGEWPENFSLLNYDDLRSFLEPQIFKDKMQPSALLGEVMSAIIRTATVDQTLEEIDHYFEIVSGLPVIDEQFRCIGVVSKKDKQRASDGLMSKVGKIMSSPAITLSPDKTVLGKAVPMLMRLNENMVLYTTADAAAVMLKQKIHRIPVVNEEGQVVGIVTRSDIFKALEGLPS
ncbi:hypothetical protein HHK36_013000 [Tetracentron sinense]|uniref:CBS domain-containing protein n=1 Tax=Tetracentron sinense TaxID=13715 RepID=A0A835DF12_TETSI|nr:hypothetical protein HHK36_013000 [Tetracentron sinense]